jgi:ABC-2 type transport system ATP-binding protein
MTLATLPRPAHTLKDSPMQSDAPIVAHIDEVSIQLGTKMILNNVDLEIRKGEMLGIIGGNGTGKSTILKLLVGLLRPDHGNVTVFDTAPTGPDVLHRIGAAIDAPALYPWMSGRAVIKTVCDLRGRPSRSAAQDTLERFGLGDAGRKPVVRYSQGMKKRLALAVASLDDPDLILLDEPTNALDPDARGIVNDWIAELRAKGTTIVVVTHRITEAEQCDRLVRLNADGQLVGGHPDDLRDV